MKGYRFFAVMPGERKSKSASKTYPFQPWTVATLERYAKDGRYVECLAVAYETGQHIDGGYKFECAGALQEKNDQAVCSSTCDADYLRSRCTRIPEALARKLHPALFRYLD